MQRLGSELKVILRHSSVFGLASVLGQFLSFILLPLYTRYLTPADYGALEILYFSSSLLTIIFGLGVNEGMSRFYFDREDPDWRRRVVSTTIIGMGSICVAAVALLLPFSGLAARALLDSPAMAVHFRVLFVSLAAQFMTSILLAYLRVRQRSGTVLFVSLAQLLVTIALNLLFIAGLGWGSLGMLAATLIAHGATAAIAVPAMLAQARAPFDRRLFREMVTYGLPLVPSSLGSYTAIASDRYILKEFSSLSATGLYSLGYKLGAMVHSLVTTSFIQIWLPRRFEHHTREDAPQVFARIFTFFLAVLVFGSLAVSLLARHLVRLLTTEEFWPAHQIVPLIALAHIVHAFYYHFTIAIAYHKRTKYYAYLNVSIGVANVALNLALIPPFGAWGAAFATLATYLLRSAGVYVFARRLEKIVFEFGAAVKVIGCAGILYALGEALANERMAIDLTIRIGLLLVYPLLLVATGVISPRELAGARDGFRQLRSVAAR